MSVLPDWNSIESTARWSDGLFWAGIIALVLLAATEVASHIYVSRSIYLASERERTQREVPSQAAKHHQQEAGRLSNELTATKDAVASTQNGSAQTYARPEAAGQSANPPQENVIRRTLSVGQKQLLVAALSPFSGQKVTIVSAASDDDGAGFKRDFVAVLKLAEWNFDENSDVAQAPIVPTSIGVQVAVNEDEARAGRVLESARVFVQTLHRLGITKGNTLFVSNQIPIGTVKLTVGTGP